jgi:hypothetical protein
VIEAVAVNTFTTTAVSTSRDAVRADPRDRPVARKIA